MKKAVAYGRFSSDNQREESIDAQFRAIKKYAEHNGIEIIDFYSDEALTGKNDDREGFQNMIRDIVRGHITVDFVLVHKFNRFARNKYDSTIYKKKLKDKNVKVVSVTQLVDDTPEGDLMEGFLEVMDEYYSANLSIEVKKGLRENALKGQVTGIVCYGFQKSADMTYEINEQEAEVVRRIYKEYATGISKAKVCEIINSEGLRNRKGRPFNVRSIGDILLNEKYIGNYIYRLSETETIRLEGAVPAIIDKELWKKARLMDKQKVKRRPNRINTYHLTGKAICQHCGCSISSGSGGKTLASGERLWYYECTGRYSKKNGCPSNKINKKWVEEAVVRSILDYALNDSALKNISSLAFAQIESVAGSSNQTVAGLRSSLSKIKEKQKRLTLLYLEGNVDKDILDAENEKLKKEKFDSELALERLETVQASVDLSENDIFEYLLDYVAKLKETITKGDDSFISSLIQTFVEKVIISKENVEIHLKLDFHSLCLDGCDKERIVGAFHNITQPEKSCDSEKLARAIGNLSQLSKVRAIPRNNLKFFGLVSILANIQ